MIKVFLIERQKIVREGIKVSLEEENDLQVFTCENKDVKVSVLNRIKPDLILVSLDNLDEADFSYLKIFLELNKNRDRISSDSLFKIVVYAEKVNEFVLNKVLSIGCQGYLLKESSIEELKQAIRSVYRGYKHIGNSVFSQVKQLSIALNGVVLESDIAQEGDNYHLGLQTSGNLGSDELNQGDFKLDKLDSLNFAPVFPEKSDNLIFKVNSIEDRLQLPGKPQKRWREVSWIMLPIALGCMAGISAAMAHSDRIDSFQPITKYGTINSNTVAIKSPSSGTVARIDRQVGDLIRVNDVVAQIEPETARLQQEKDATSTKIEQTKRQIEAQKQSLAGELAQLKQKQQKLKQLLTSSIGDRNKLTASLLPQLNKLNTQVAEAYKDYQSLKQLNQQNIVSRSELTRARQTWLNAKSELVQNKNSQQQSKDSQIAELKIERELQQQLNGWQNQVSTRSKIIGVLERDLANLHDRLQQVNDELLDSSEAIALKAPSNGIIKQITSPGDRIVAKDETIFDLLSCQNLWVEVDLSGESLRQIDFQQPVGFKLGKNPHNLTGKISAIESLAQYNQTKVKSLRSASTRRYKYSSVQVLVGQQLGEESSELRALNLPYDKTSISHSYLADDTVEKETMYKVIVYFPLLENYTQQQEFCGLGDGGLITFNN